MTVLLRFLLFCFAASLAVASAFAQQHVVVVLDDSGSMEGRMGGSQIVKMDAAKQALDAMLTGLPPDAEVGILTLNTKAENGNWVVPLEPVDNRRSQQALRAIRASGNTPLGAALKTATDALLEKRRETVYGTYRLLIVTDGQASDQYLMDRYLPDIKSRGIILDVIGVDMRGDHRLATEVTKYRRADDPESLKQAVAEVFAESGGDDDASAEADFEMLAALPDELAAATLKQLTSTNNQPVKQSDPSETLADASDSGQTSLPSGARPSESDSGSALGMLANCVGCFLFLGIIVLVFVVLSIVMRRRG